MPVRQYANAPATTLANSCTALATSIVVTSTTGLPITFPYTLIIDRGLSTEEAVSVTAAAGTTLTVTRGIDGTTAFAHAANAVVAHGITAQDIREANAHVNATSAVHGLTGSVVGTSDTQTLTNKTISADNNDISGLPASSFATTDASGLLNGAAAAKAIPSGVVVGTTDTQTLTNKTLTSPTLTTPTLTTPTMSAPIATGSLASFGGAWTAYTPTWATTGTAANIGNGTLAGRYLQLGKLVLVQLDFVAGGTTTFGTGFWTFSIPVAARLTSNALFGGQLVAVDTSTSSFYMLFARPNSSTVIDLPFHSAGADAQLATIAGTTLPFTWASGDIIRGYFFYEAA